MNTPARCAEADVIEYLRGASRSDKLTADLAGKAGALLSATLFGKLMSSRSLAKGDGRVQVLQNSEANGQSRTDYVGAWAQLSKVWEYIRPDA